ncbi:FAD-dependent oxidoreductase [Metabacillus sp. RGM 3146]|uniref:FAD-dependent oxidoreductase n=1 Tax=Metabacillus sp. RGM 3146 TaxID=3401092 RepID=UPI003B9D52D9
MKTQVLVIGGGVGGLTVALKLARCGIDVCVIEMLKGNAAMYKGELLQPKSIQILQDLNLKKQVEAAGHKINEIQVIEKREKNTVYETIGCSSMNYNILNSPFDYALMIPHEKLKALLLEEAKKHASFTYIQPSRFKAFRNEKAVVDLEEKEVEIEADVFVAAEGRKSKTREAMNIKVKEHKYDHHFLTVSFPRPEDLKEGKMISTPHTFLGLFPLPNNMVRTVYLIPQGAYKGMKEKGISVFYEAYSELYPELADYVKHIKSWREIQLMIPVHFNADQYVKDNVVIMGDAAHSVHPMAGEGMNLAIQDGDVLGELLCWIIREHADLSCLKWYEKVRKPRVHHVLHLSHMSALAYSSPFRYFPNVRKKAIRQMTLDEKLHTKQMLNASGLGFWKESIFDRMVQIGLFPIRSNPSLSYNGYMFTEETDYPWEEGGRAR